tara:strand:+ start:2617 stop:3636 length:1020 start_codon:yes stop_codon:yes gene_type:complete
MEKEESKLVEEVVETTDSKESSDKFNPLAFTSDLPDLAEAIEKKEETENTTETKEDVVESKEQEEKTEEPEDGFSWDKQEEEEKTEEDQYNWENSEEKEENPTTEEQLTWAKVGKELGIEIENRDDFVKVLNNYAQELQQTQQPANSQITELKSYLNFKDRDLVAEELKADGIDASEIEESLDKLEDSGMLKMKAKSIRRVINNAITQQTEQTKNEQQQSQQKNQQDAIKAKKELQKTIKSMDEFMGGKVTKKQKEEVYQYATSKMMNDIYANHANVADVAMFMLYRKQIEKILRSQGLEDGKAAIMDSIVSPNLNSGKGKSNFKVKTGKFDPKAFMSE